MLGHVLSWLSKAAEWTIRLDGPPPPEREAELRVIIQAFFAAHHGTLRGWDSDALMEAAQSLPWNIRLFFWEGHAFGCAMRSAMGLTREHPLDQNRAPGYRYMLYTGTGFYNGMALAYGLPRVDMTAPRWAEEADRFSGTALELGGQTFGVGLRFPDPRVALSRVTGLGGDAVGLAMGLGRVLWFHYAHRFDRLEAVMLRHPELAEELALGLGVAMTYTQLAWPERVVASIEAMSEPHRPWLRRGARLALAAGLREGVDFAEGLRALPAPLSLWLEEGERAMETVPENPTFSASFKQALQDTEP